jgi:hypothetical protein
VLQIDFILKEIFPIVSDMTALKNPLPKRQKGNRLLIIMAKKLGETGFDKESMIIKLV